MYLVDNTMPNPTVNPLYTGAIITHRWHLEGIVLFLCSDTVPKGAQSQQVLLSLCNALSTVAKQRKLVSHPCWWCWTQQHPLPPPTVWHQRRTRQMAARV